MSSKSNTQSNTPWHVLSVGQSATIERTVRAEDLFVFAHASGNTNPLTLPQMQAPEAGKAVTQPVAPSLWVGSLVSAVLGTLLPGAGTLYRAQNFRFLARAQIGDRLIVSVRCLEKLEKPCARFETRVTRADGTLLLDGEAEVEVPLEHIELDAAQLPALLMDSVDHFGRLINRCRQLEPMPTVVVCPDDRNALGGALMARDEGLMKPFFVGDAAAIHRAAEALGADISGIPLVDVAEHDEAAAKAVAMVHAREVRAVMKGNIHSDTLLAHIVKKEGGLRGPRRLSHVFAMDVPTLEHMLFISDAAINIAPDLATKVDIVQNAIDLALACGIAQPKVGVLAAVETVNINMPATLDAAALSKMAERGQIRGGIVDGPLAMDNAIDREAARTKGIKGLVAGQAEVLIVPNLEAGNMLAKELTFAARAEAAGLVVGARVPVMLTSRADNARARLASCALAMLYDYWRARGAALEDLPLPEGAPSRKVVV
jgi:phosphotransacetylase/acyl dehydratase